MKRIKETIVVEGKSDVSKLASFLDCDFIITNGYSLDKQTIELIRIAKEKNGVILFLDPDGPGNKIRQMIDSQVEGCKHAFISNKVAKKGKKIGVCETNKKYILEALENLVTFDNKIINITLDDFYKLGLTGKDNSLSLRRKVEEYYHIGSIAGRSTSKTLLKRLNMLNVNYEELKKVMEEL